MNEARRGLWRPLWRWLLAGWLAVSVLVGVDLPARVAAGSSPSQIEYATVEVIGFARNARGTYDVVGWGSGGLVEQDGLIVTAFHVVGDPLTRQLYNPDGVVGISLVNVLGQAPVPAYLGTVITHSATLDLALVQIDRTLSGQRLPDYTFFPILSLPGLRDRPPGSGAPIKAYGYGAGFDHPIGALSGRLMRYSTLNGYGGKPMVVSTTAAYAPGLTGGPVVDANGLFIGTALGMSGRGTAAQAVVRPWAEIRAWATGQVTTTQTAAPVVITGRIVNHATQRGLAGAQFIVLKPNVATEDFLANPQQSDVAALGASDRDGRFVTDPAIAYNSGYNMVVYASGYRMAFTTTPIVLDATTCPGRPRCDFAIIELESAGP